MPTYEYKCTTCHTPLEVVQAITEPSLTDCPNCPGGRLRKVFGNVGVVFKGSGFYRNDSREKAKAGAKSDAGSTSKSDAKGARTSEGAKSGSADSGSSSNAESGAKADASSGSTSSGSASAPSKSPTPTKP